MASGLISQFTLATDTFDQLVKAIEICMKWNSKISHWRTGNDHYGDPYIIFMWGVDSTKLANQMIAPIDNAEVMADQVYAWLKTAKYPKQYDTGDGHCCKGWLLTTSAPLVAKGEQPYTDKHDSTGYDVFCIQPYWSEYGK